LGKEETHLEPGFEHANNFGSGSGSATLLDIGKNYEKVGEKPEENV
jgi:hypothetical protein